jgi:hypothetical protein
VWAQQTITGHGKSSDNRVFFDGPIIYSYGHHFPIARFVTNKRGTCVLFTSKGYSVSTSKHKGHVRGALRSNATVFYVDDIRNDPTADDIKRAQVTLNESVAAFGRTSPYSVDDAVESFEGTALRLNEMAKFFGIRSKVKCPAIPADVIEKVRVRVAKRVERRRLLDATRATQYEAQSAKNKADYLQGMRHDMYKAEWGQGAAFTDAENEQHAAAYALIMADTVKAWREGKPTMWGWNGAPSETMLRIHGDNIETSRGAVFPVTHGKRAFQLIAECRAMVRFWEKNGHSIQLGTFQIDRIDADGTVHAGCHVVPWSEIERTARTLGLI